MGRGCNRPQNGLESGLWRDPCCTYRVSLTSEETDHSLDLKGLNPEIWTNTFCSFCLCFPHTPSRERQCSFRLSRAMLVSIRDEV